MERMYMTDKILFEGKAKVDLTHVGTLIQTTKYKDKFGTVRVGQSRHCAISTDWGYLQLPDYPDMNKYGNKEIKITVEIKKRGKKTQSDVNRKSLIKWLKEQKRIAGSRTNMNCLMSSYHKGRKANCQHLIDMLESNRFRL